MEHLTETLADAMSESDSEICSIFGDGRDDERCKAYIPHKIAGKRSQ